MSLVGKGIFIWKIKECEGGDISTIADMAEEAGFSHVVIKIADGAYSYNYDWQKRVDFVPPLVAELRERGISPWGWHYVRGDAPGAEARKAVERVKNLGLDGYVIDAEREYKNRYDAANTYMRIIRKELPNTPIALASYRYPSLHPHFPWRNFLSKCDLNMPQMYWQGASNPKVQLRRCFEEFDNMNNRRPIFPIGAAYSEHGWTPKSSEIVDFLNEAQRLKLSGANFWEWSHARKIKLWDTVADYQWPKTAEKTDVPKPPDPEPQSEPPTPVPGTGQAPDIVNLYIAALNSGKPDAVMKLFKTDAIHFDPGDTLQGAGEIIGWYAKLFVLTMPRAHYQLTSTNHGKSIRRFSWRATLQNGQVIQGSDLFALFGGRIGFHSTTFSQK